ncbi:sensor histidine kinase [Cellulosimicrobium terreum]|nr:sensor histidine kinase [Cellulosimicrobium terreum]
MAGHATRDDVLLAGACALAGGFLAVLRAPPDLGWATTTAEIAAQVAGAALLLGRRRAPLLVLAACGLLSFVSPVVATVGALYSVGALVTAPLASAVAVVGTTALALPVWRTSTATTPPTVLWGGILVLLFAYFAGRSRRLQIEGDRRATQHAQVAARAAERASLARELHDVVAHRISYVVVEAGVIGTTTQDEEVRRLAGEISDGGRAALAEMRQVLTALAATVPGAPADAGRAPSPGSDPDLDRLVDEVRRTGQPVELSVRVAPSSPSDLVDRTVTRVVSEGLTNAVRHAPGAATTVTVEPVDAGVRVDVENAAPTAPATGLTTGGFGLAGLRERVGLLGGTLEAGPTAAGGYLLRATLPRRTA